MKVLNSLIVRGSFALGLLLMLMLVFVQSVLAETTQFAYGVNAGDWSVTQYRVNPETGALRHNGHQPVIKFPVALAVHPSKRFVITAVKTTAKVAVFQVDPLNGHLEEIPQSPFSISTTPTVRAASPYSVSIHPSGQFVYVAARWGGVVAFEMDQQNGVLTLLSGSPFAAENRTRALKVHPSGRFLYASNAYSNSISAYRVNEKTGVLTPVAGSPFDTGEAGSLTPEELRRVDAPPKAGGVPYWVEIHPSGRFVYITNRAGPSLSVFNVDAESGVLTPLKGSPMELDARPYGVSAHPSGRFLYVTGWDIGALWGFAIDASSGQLAPLSEPIFDTEGEAPISVSFNSDGTRAYVPNVGSSSISQFDVNPRSGTLSLIETVRTRYAPFGLALLETEPVKREPRFAFIVRNKQGQLRVLRENDESVLRTAQKVLEKEASPTKEASPIKGTSPIQAMHIAVVDPLGHFVYMANKLGEKNDENGISAYRIDSTNGDLTHLPKESIRLGFAPTDLAIDASGRALYAVNPSIDVYGVFSVNPESGALLLPQYELPEMSKGAAAIALDPVARFSFVANPKENTVSVFTHGRMHSPALFPLENDGSVFAVGEHPVALAVDSTGKFLVVANQGSNNLSVFSIHFHEGRLEAVEGSPFASGKAPTSIAMHSNGKFVYVINADDGDISSYRLDSLSGKLSALPQRVDAGKQPVTITLSSNGHFAYVRNEGSNLLRKYALNEDNGLLTFSGMIDVGAMVTVAQ